MKKRFSSEFRSQYAKTVSLYRNKNDEKPVFSVSFSGETRIPVVRLLIATAVAAGALLIAAVSAELDRTDKNKNRPKS